MKSCSLDNVLNPRIIISITQHLKTKVTLKVSIGNIHRLQQKHRNWLNMQTNKTVTKKHVNCSTHPQTPVTSFLWLNKPHQNWLKFKQHFPMLNTIITLQQISMCYAIIFKIVLFYCYEMYKYVLPFLIHVNFYISCLLSCNLSYLLHQFLSTCGTKVHFCLHLGRLRES